MAPPKNASWNHVVSPAVPPKGVFPPVLSPPGLTVEGHGSTNNAPAGPYAQAQEDEIQVLQAIYMEDYEDVETRGAWSRTSDRAFRLRLKAPENPSVSLTLSVKLTATYPKTIPLLSIDNSVSLRRKTQQDLDILLRSKPKELLGEVMIHDIALSIQDILEDEVVARDRDEAGASLIEEHAAQEAQAEQRAIEEQRSLMRKEEEDKAEEQRVLAQMVEEELAKQRKEAKRKSKLTQPLLSPELIKSSNSGQLTFDRVIEIQDQGSTLIFGAVSSLAPLRKGPLTEVLTAQPAVASSISPTLIIKQAIILSPTSKESRLKKAMREFEDELEELKRIRQPNIVALIDFKIEKLPGLPLGHDNSWQITMLTEFANKGSLSEMLEFVESFPVEKVRSWTIELLEALEFFHRNGIVHRRIHAGNVLLFVPPHGGPPTVKLSDGGYQEYLYELRNISRSSAKFASAMSAYWVPPELNNEASTKRTRKTDIWEVGVVFLQMLFGLSVLEKYDSPSAVLEQMDLSDALEEMLRKLFKPDPKKRPAAFDLIPCEFLRNDVPVLSATAPTLHSRMSSSSINLPERRLRRESSAGVAGPFSRFASEWVESGRLGKGGYGEVVKARNKLDGRIYAIKKIKQNSASALTEVLSEVMLLSRLNHPYVVRYYTAWPEDDVSGVSETEEDSSTLPDESSSAPLRTKPGLDYATSTGGLDFISSSGFPRIEFGEDSDDGDDEEDDDGVVFGSDTDDDLDELGLDGKKSPSPLKLRRTISSNRNARTVKTTLYIQMEYCERHTLRDLIRRGLYDDTDESWKLFRQVLEGLVHIHGHGIIHRDLKPDNVFIDVANTPRIGDFGLATSGQYHVADKSYLTPNVDGDMTRSIGTTLYVAPELKSGVGGGNYNDKVDMYSLGIIFFEMCHPLKTAMERDQVIRALREKEHALPPDFESSERSLQGSIIMSLIRHKPSERPTSLELLHSGKLPLQIEDETIREALKGISDPSSPYYQRMMSALFSKNPDTQVKDQAWDIGMASGMHNLKLGDVLLQNTVKEHLTAVFRRHGAVETPRQQVIPRSLHYANSNVAQLLDSSGTLVQLPYDLILPYARSIARQAPPADRTFAFGSVYRDTHTGGAPKSTGEADFDIVSYGTLDLALKEAEVIKVMDEVIDEFPSVSSAQMCFHLNHSILLDLILDFCRISSSQRHAVKEVLSKLNIDQWTWQKIRNELRSPTIGISGMSLDDLAKFDWRDTPEKAMSKLRITFEGTDLIDRSQGVFAHMSAVIGYLKLFNVHRRVYICPLSNFNERFYSGGILFQCLYDTKRRAVLAAGGRYDKLIEEHRPKVQGQFTGCHAVGMNIGWERLVSSMSRYYKQVPKSPFLAKRATDTDSMTGQWAARRCDVLVASFDSGTLRSIGVRMVADIWANDLSAELAVDSRSPEQLLSLYKEDKHSWIVIIKHDAAALGKPDLKVKSMIKKEDTDIRSSELFSYLRAELRDRDHRDGVAISSTRPSSRFLRTHNSSDSHSIPTMSSVSASRSNVEVLVAQHRSKKMNRLPVIEAAQSRSRELLNGFLTAPIAAIETKDQTMEAIRETRMSDPDGWRRVIQSVPLAEREYLQDVHNMLTRYAKRWKDEGHPAEGRAAFVYNFRTTGCFLYDLGL
ncbi:kinase-like protein [Pseudovirgaria hyperparasitica]|uniref:non-specific serine/threonine protein kinase n=1 Tax=Pseudovirgaria hyperparasitica TaxID=470096 RepID=A0A6A6W174_9PEZI|nr:kinase-like protein [Pseudovirgaria hyperparasitica]KAF2755846.1 kinase-like protein [Pseudovirgaria hyperparasitica]